MQNTEVAGKTFSLVSFAKGVLLQNDEGELRLAPQGTLKLFLQMEARTKVHIRVMSLLNYEGQSVLKNVVGACFTMEGSITYERRYFFKTNKSMPYYQDAMIFTGIGGEYTVINASKNDNDSGRKGKTTEIQSKPKKFMLMQPDTYVSQPEPIF